nr:hypothetical protein CFP56_19371 [Quercus suber]
MSNGRIVVTSWVVSHFIDQKHGYLAVRQRADPTEFLSRSCKNVYHRLTLSASCLAFLSVSIPIRPNIPHKAQRTVYGSMRFGTALLRIVPTYNKLFAIGDDLRMYKANVTIPKCSIMFAEPTSFALITPALTPSLDLRVGSLANGPNAHGVASLAQTRTFRVDLKHQQLRAWYSMEGA